MALQSCTIHSRTPPGVLCGTVQDLCRCLTPLLERGYLLDLNMLDMRRKDPMIPGPAERALLPRPRVEESISVPAPSKPTTLESEEATPPEEFALVLRRRPLVPLGLPFHSPAHPSRGGRLAHEHTPGSPTRFCFLGVPADNHISLPSDGQGMI